MALRPFLSGSYVREVQQRSANLSTSPLERSYEPSLGFFGGEGGVFSPIQKKASRLLWVMASPTT